jgi:hypothetical protein
VVSVRAMVVGFRVEFGVWWYCSVEEDGWVGVDQGEESEEQRCLM